MKYKVQLLNYDSQWVDYCKAPTLHYAQEAMADLRNHGFKYFQFRIVDA